MTQDKPSTSSGPDKSATRPAKPRGPLEDVARPKRAVVTAGMPYANGPLHLGHLAGAHLPADIHARWLRMLIGNDNVLFVCGSDDHGTAAELAAIKAGKATRELVTETRTAQQRTLERYSIGLDAYLGTSMEGVLESHAALCNDFLDKARQNGLLHKRPSRQWFDVESNRFLPDRFVLGRCPNPKCGNESAYSDECEVCGAQYDPSALLQPRSAISASTPEMRETTHLWLDMAAVAETLRIWVQSKRDWRPNVINTALDKVMPALRFARAHEDAYKAARDRLPKHKMRYTRGGEIEAVFNNAADLSAARSELDQHQIASTPVVEWGLRSITRDIAWGIPVRTDDPSLADKTLYVWPDSLIAPISFTRRALELKRQDPAQAEPFWRDPESRIYQFLGQDNVFFYVVMQGALWLSTQDDPHRLPKAGELQLTDVFGCFHLLVDGEKMSKSRGNFFTGDQLLDEKGYDPDQIRYFVALLGLAEKPSNFSFAQLDARNRFLAGPLNAAIERPISAAFSQFGGVVPDGTLIDDVAPETEKMIRRYVKAMERTSYPALLFELENYARRINKLFTRYKPHDDRHPVEGRRNALFSAFYVLKTLMIMLYPFVPATMNRVRESLALPPEVFSVEELGRPIAPGHRLSGMQTYFPLVADEGGQADAEH